MAHRINVSPSRSSRHPYKPWKLHQILSNIGTRHKVVHYSHMSMSSLGMQPRLELQGCPIHSKDPGLSRRTNFRHRNHPTTLPRSNCSPFNMSNVSLRECQSTHYYYIKSLCPTMHVELQTLSYADLLHDTYALSDLCFYFQTRSSEIRPGRYAEAMTCFPLNSSKATRSWISTNLIITRTGKNTWPHDSCMFIREEPFPTRPHQQTGSPQSHSSKSWASPLSNFAVVSSQVHFHMLFFWRTAKRKQASAKPEHQLWAV